MSSSDDFYVLMSGLLQKIARNPDASPVIPLECWPIGSLEQSLLEALRSALAALQTGNQNNSDRTQRAQQYKSIFDTAGDGLISNDLETGLVMEKLTLR
jgi:hypothetical protein